jgi:activator of 2-hydroxyglutaryl-CoA dehydratase
MKIGLDVGSTTIKSVVLDDDNQIIFKSYERHYSQITEKITALLTKIRNEVVCGQDAQLTISGTAGMGISETCDLQLYRKCMQHVLPQGVCCPKPTVLLSSAAKTRKSFS